MLLKTGGRRAHTEGTGPARPAGHWEVLVAGISTGTLVEFNARHSIYVQGEPADAVYFLLRGKVTLTVVSDEGKEAIVATLGPGEFFGEGSLTSQAMRTGSARSATRCSLAKVAKEAMARLIHEKQGLAEAFIAQLLTRLARSEADLVDQMFNSSERRLARILLLLSHFGDNSTTATVVDGVSQEHLAQMVGTTRARISSFMNKFRRLGYVHYDAHQSLTVHRGLLRVLGRT